MSVDCSTSALVVTNPGFVDLEDSRRVGASSLYV